MSRHRKPSREMGFSIPCDCGRPATMRWSGNKGVCEICFFRDKKRATEGRSEKVHALARVPVSKRRQVSTVRDELPFPYIPNFSVE